ncbi:SIMPL domain-containing protein [Mycobacterium bourgelatii]|uniref:SIMPL domain-containing protein n=1 Tax=Mycobacterium bourgelatii TaxID=1273442 RepID=A0A7I9YX51_MYCBU|nr:SIMPL domain-containing protein [Mycobacterium bourgelatii]MCV6973178.1 SIMPL domain-containing protein [Mycobacterium bourgelatii]GFG93215.1 SIMPL domain-containing protein [Mycobacterium bourgelatii]
MPIFRSSAQFVRTAIASAGIVLAAATMAACDSHIPSSSASNPSPRQVTVVGSGQVQGVPDTLTADITISFTASDVTSAMNQTNGRQRAVIEALTRAGMDNKDIRTTDVILQAQYSIAEPGGSPTITGYRADNAIQVKIHPADTASRLLALIIDTGGDATRITAVRYKIADDSQLVKDARARAYDDAKNRAQQYAELSGLTLGKVISISESTGPAPVEAPQAPAPRASTLPLEPGQQTVNFSVTAVWELD